jgi:hypothetical protein
MSQRRVSAASSRQTKATFIAKTQSSPTLCSATRARVGDRISETVDLRDDQLPPNLAKIIGEEWQSVTSSTFSSKPRRRYKYKE